MQISFSPQRSDAALSLEVTTGDRLRINGELFNFDPLPEGGTIPAGAIPCEWIAGPVERVEGEVRLTVILPHGPSPEPWQRFPEPMVVSDSGPVDIPVDTTVEVTELQVEGGRNIITTTRRWHQDDEVQEVFVPDPPPPAEPDSDSEEPANVDA